MKILIGCPARQDEETFTKYLESLSELEFGDHEVDFYFILHNSPHLKKFFTENQYEEFYSDNEYVKNEDTHTWAIENLSDVIKMKNRLIDKVIKENYDYFFMIDSDILIHKDTLTHLIKQDKDIIAEVFFTMWNLGGAEDPNAWTHDFYSFINPSTIETWKHKGIYEVGGTGACILIKRNVLEAGVNYMPIKNISFSLWEDRAFCIRASVLGFNIFLDTNYPAKHLYRKDK